MTYHDDSHISGARGRRGRGVPGESRARRDGYGDAFEPGQMPDYLAGRGFGPRRRRGGRGPIPEGAGAPDFAGGPHRGHRGHGRGRRGPRPRGDVRAAILLLLAEEPRHGYQLIQEIGERSSGAWTPSPGSIYPTLQALEDEGLLTIENIEGRRTAALTEAGRTYVEENRASLGTPWEVGGPDAALAVRRSMMAFMDAAKQVVRVGDAAQQQAAVAILDGARKDLYRVLAEDSEAADTDTDS
ncbi:PadR family transcriptional regulator [Occultella kanbiaonis]|uniref:PadR family transcriptional regulator n=1 Tax=Occultella kanbiaonis TaxID=2675754 RepID=UPI001B355BBD|nr:PadR family transcriptional regulator [Occultella kanbiaonis]